MNGEPDCVTPQASYQVHASEQQVSTEPSEEEKKRALMQNI